MYSVIFQRWSQLSDKMRLNVLLLILTSHWEVKQVIQLWLSLKHKIFLIYRLQNCISQLNPENTGRIWEKFFILSPMSPNVFRDLTHSKDSTLAPQHGLMSEGVSIFYNALQCWCNSNLSMHCFLYCFDCAMWHNWLQSTDPLKSLGNPKISQADSEMWWLQL